MMQDKYILGLHGFSSTSHRVMHNSGVCIIKKDDIILDYLASESDTKISNFEIVFKVIKESGGIINYLESCALSKIQITKLRQKICN